MKLSVTGEAYDIPTLEDMPIEEYHRYLETDLLFVDPHDVLRSGIGGFPLAATPEQAKALMAFLQDNMERIGREYRR